MFQDNLDPFLNTGITSADFSKLGKIMFSKELLMIAERNRNLILNFLQDWCGYPVRSSAFIRIEGLHQVRYFFWNSWCHEERFCLWVFKVIRKIPIYWWYVFLEFFAYSCKVIIEMFCNIFWLTYKSQGFTQAILMSSRWYKKLNLLIEFSDSIFIKLHF